jgi:ribosomal protein S18 acetylase RimI-like enzyme
MLRHALRRDLDTIVDIWTDAFAGDPFFRWIVPEEGAWNGFGSEWFAFIAGLSFERGHTYLYEGGDAAVAWIPPDLDLLGPDDFERVVGILRRHALEGRGEQAVETIVAARGHTPTSSHWTLQFIGVRASARGRGLGTSITAPMLAVCDYEGMSCSLNSSNPANVPFYRRLGFEVTAECWSPDDAVCLRPMQRAAGIR